MVARPDDAPRRAPELLRPARAPARRFVRPARRRRALRQRVERHAVSRRPVRGARRPSRVALRARGGDGREVPDRPRGALRGRHEARPGRPRHLPPDERPDRARRQAPRRRRHRPRAARPQSGPSLLRLLDERRRPRAAAPRTVGARARPRSAAGPRSRSGCARRARRPSSSAPA